VKKLEVKRFEGKPDVFVMSRDNIVGVTTSEHLKNENKPLKQILEEVCKDAKEYANAIFHKYDYPEGDWYPCGSADVVLQWNDTGNREIIQLFKKEGVPDGNGFWTGWFGRLYKTEKQGWWWFPELEVGSQALRFEEAICGFVRDRLAAANIRVWVRTWVD